MSTDEIGTQARADARWAQFLSRCPDYQRTSALDTLRATEYSYVDTEDHVYLDYTGAGLAAHAQLHAHVDRLSRTCLGNPHSASPASQASTRMVESARLAILRHFNADPAEYTAIFTPNATAACKLVAEAFDFTPDTTLALLFDNHNSVNGIREYARTKGAPTVYLPIEPRELRADPKQVAAALADSRGTGRGLFAFPAQSNFSGVQHPLELIEQASALGYDVLLDAAAFVPTNSLDLSVVRPDFVAVSWYKVFGYPTGIGSLIARRSALSRLRRPWFSGGTIQAASVQGDWYALAPDEAGFEDGTVNFLSIPDVEFGLSWVAGIGVDVIHERARSLTDWLLYGLSELRHSNGKPVVHLYGPQTTDARGGTVAFNFFDPDGHVVDERIVEADTSAAGFSVRTGCFCNPGAGETAFEIRREDLAGSIRDQIRSIDDYLRILHLPSGGAIRVSCGIASTYSDIERFLRFSEQTYRDVVPRQRQLPARDRC